MWVGILLAAMCLLCRCETNPSPAVPVRAAPLPEQVRQPRSGSRAFASGGTWLQLNPNAVHASNSCKLVLLNVAAFQTQRVMSLFLAAIRLQPFGTLVLSAYL